MLAFGSSNGFEALDVSSFWENVKKRKEKQKRKTDGQQKKQRISAAHTHVGVGVCSSDGRTLPPALSSLFPLSQRFSKMPNKTQRPAFVSMKYMTASHESRFEAQSGEVSVFLQTGHTGAPSRSFAITRLQIPIEIIWSDVITP